MIMRIFLTTMLVAVSVVAIWGINVVGQTGTMGETSIFALLGTAVLTWLWWHLAMEKWK